MRPSHHHLLISQDHLPLESVSDRSREIDSRLTFLGLRESNENDDQACKSLVRLEDNSASQPPTHKRTHVVINTSRLHDEDAVHTKHTHLEK